MKFHKTLAAAAASFALMASAASALTIDGGWEVGEVAAANTSYSFYNFSLAGSAYFRITDGYVAGDIWGVEINAAPAVTTTFTGYGSGFGDDAAADAAWTSAAYSSGEYLLTAGNYTIAIEGDGAGGIPAGFYARLDSVSGLSAVPLPASAPLLIAALGGLGIARRKRKSN